ncbi:hypothetical protein [Salipaludibacillus daqingensis]|uniref:hypothetical protein n=1 Tax=Salipaludibacillus daqingensis TaxID=3041001 RepID=UPI0024744F29|nr:hypothetical protein [Salipaludibacillus daqingensis]
MGSKWLTSTLFATAVAAGSYYLGKPENREKVTHRVNQLKAKINNKTNKDHQSHLTEKVGHSDPYDIEDNSMVDEGATFSVNYYNEKLKQ